MKDVTLRQLRYFDALARHGHFGQAAAASSISQPALSVQIRELEATLGATLFGSPREPHAERKTQTEELLRGLIEYQNDSREGERNQEAGRLQQE